jgi:3D (Asp-Asp-Asp) domain-containing protein
MLATENRHEHAAISHNAQEVKYSCRRTKSARRVRSALVLGRMRTRAARFGGLAAALTLTAASAALAAPGTAARGGAGRADGTTQQLDAQAHQALLSLYALDSRLQAWQARVASLEQQAAALRAERASVRKELGAARASLETGRHRLSVDLRALYERGNVDPVAVVLGAESLTKGLRRLDDLSRVSDQSRKIVAATTAARERLLGSQRRLAAQERRLARSLAAARQAAQSLARTATARRAYISSLQARERMQAAEVRSVEAAAHAAQQKSQRLQRTTPPSPPAGKRQLTVSATCYDLPGTTATGMPVGHGVVAVDPSVIPLGTRMYIPGYGNGVAADVGSGVKGAVIDLWMTPTECGAWGRRTVTITIY